MFSLSQIQYSKSVLILEAEKPVYERKEYYSPFFISFIFFMTKTREKH